MSVCNNQDTFNKSFEKAVKYVNKKEKPKVWVQIVLALIVVIVIVWAVLLANKVNSSDQIMHFVLAFAFAPFYIISYYLSQ